MSSVKISDLVDKADSIVRELANHGRIVEEPIFSVVKGDLAASLAKVRSFYIRFIKRYRDGTMTFGEGLREFLSIENVDSLARYLILAASLASSVRFIKIDEFYRALNQTLDYAVKLVNEPTRENSLKLSSEFLKNYSHANEDDVNAALRQYTVMVRRMSVRENAIAKEIAVTRLYVRLENFLREFMYPKATMHRNKAVRMLVRWIAHETGAPMALKIMVKGEDRQYTPIGDVYASTAIMRTGAFLKLAKDPRVRVMYLRYLDEGSLEVPYDIARAISIKVIKSSPDPISVEKGAFDIGYRYCSKGLCESCPLRNTCLRLVGIRVKA